MNPFAIALRPAVNKPEKIKLRDVPPGTEVVQEGGSIVLRRIVDVKKFRKIADKVLANRPKLKKGASIVRELNESRHRGRR